MVKIPWYFNHVMIAMHRFALDYLGEWKGRKSRKPLVVRGARQVGKSHLIKDFGQQEFEDVLEINFD